jgi:hypothetical protein
MEDFNVDVHSVYKELELDNYLCFPKNFDTKLLSNQTTKFNTKLFLKFCDKSLDGCIDLKNQTNLQEFRKQYGYR